MASDADTHEQTEDTNGNINDSSSSRNDFLPAFPDYCDVCGKHWDDPKPRTVDMHKLAKHQIPMPKKNDSRGQQSANPRVTGSGSAKSSAKPASRDPIKFEQTEARWTPVEKSEAEEYRRKKELLDEKNAYYESKQLNDRYTAGERDEQRFHSEQQENVLLNLVSPLLQNAIRPPDNSAIEAQLYEEKQARQKLEDEIRERDRQERQQMMEELRQLRSDMQFNQRNYNDFWHELGSSGIQMFKEGYKAKLSNNSPGLSKKIEAADMLENTPPITENKVLRRKTDSSILDEIPKELVTEDE